MRELTVERQLVRAIKALGGRADKYRTPARRNAPDRICLFPRALCFFVECKASGKKPRPGQVREAKRLRALGFEVFTVASRADVGYVVQWLVLRGYAQ